MAGLRAVLLVLVALVLAGGAVAHAHPEPNDVDGDNVLNVNDNCVDTPNGSQLNADGDAQGDACDADDDADAIPDSADNCRLVANPGQEGVPFPGRGTACPAAHSDADAINDDDDNCDLVANADQRDLDGDDQGDACDRDDDGDRIDDGFDNCPTIYNPEYPQNDFDGDGVGSACDAQELIAGPAGGAAGGGVGAGGSAAAGDNSAPFVTVAVARRQRLADAGRALVVTVSCSEACSMQAVLAADASAARRARLGRLRVTLARGSWSLAGRGRTYVFARWTPAARKLRGGRRLAAALRLTATDAAGNRRTVTRPVELRR